MINKYITIAVIVIYALMGLTIYMLKKENNRLHENEGIYKAQIQELGSTIQQKDRDIQLCNERTEQFKAESEKRAADAEKARKIARDAGKANRDLADKLLQAQAKPNESDCETANRIFNEYLDQRHP